MSRQSINLLNFLKNYSTEFCTFNGLIYLIIPVSYTHLDVYKRQVCVCVCVRARVCAVVLATCAQKKKRAGEGM